MPYQNKTRKLNVVKIGPNQLSRYMIFFQSSLSLSLSENKLLFCNPGLQGTVNCF